MEAIEVARRQQAKSLELRAVLSLARLCQRQQKTVATQQMLADIYGCFTEGFNTADPLGGHLKTGQLGSLQNRPVEAVI